MQYLIILIVFAIIVGPLMWMMPSPKQRREEAVRLRAHSLGLQVKVCDLPQSHRQVVRKERPIQGVVYRLPILMNRPVTRKVSFRVQKAQDALEWIGPESQELQACLESGLKRAPNDVVSIEYSAVGVACYWREKGGIAAVDEIYQLLTILRTELNELEVDL